MISVEQNLFGFVVLFIDLCFVRPWLTLLPMLSDPNSPRGSPPCKEYKEPKNHAFLYLPSGVPVATITKAILEMLHLQTTRLSLFSLGVSKLGIPQVYSQPRALEADTIQTKETKN